MYKKIFLPILSLFCFFVFASQAQAANFSFSPASGSIDPTDGGQINVLIDSGSESLESATAVIVYDSTKIDITSVDQGSYFSVISTDSSATNEIVITGNVTFGDQIGVSGSGTLATLNISPKVSSGSFTLTLRCGASESDDSNIIEISNKTNLLASDSQCSTNGSGSYTITSGSSDSSPTATTAPTGTSDSSPTTAPTTATSQPAVPETLPQSGPEDWLKWLTSGLALIGVGLLLL